MSVADWATAYARQARADFVLWDRLQRTSGVHACHRLHLLQMACEKLSKAYLCSQLGADPRTLQSSHAYIAKTLPIIAREQYARTARVRLKEHDFRFRLIKQLAREIELLSPAVDDNGRRPDNCEYPWEVRAGEIRVPCDYKFPNLDLLHRKAGTTFLKFIELAIAAVPA